MFTLSISWNSAHLKTIPRKSQELLHLGSRCSRRSHTYPSSSQYPEQWQDTPLDSQDCWREARTEAGLKGFKAENKTDWTRFRFGERGGTTERPQKIEKQLVIRPTKWLSELKAITTQAWHPEFNARTGLGVAGRCWGANTQNLVHVRQVFYNGA